MQTLVAPSVFAANGYNLSYDMRWALLDAPYVTHFAHFPHDEFVLGYYDGTLKTLKHGQQQLFPKTRSRVLSMLALKNGQLMTNHADGMLYVWNREKRELLHHAVFGRISVLIELPDNTLAMALQEGHILRYNLNKQKVFDYIGTSSSRNSDLLIHLPNGELLSGRRDVGMLCFWNIETKRRLKLFRTHTDLYAAALIDATHLATSHRNGNVYIWNLETEACVGELSNHFNLIHSLTTLPTHHFATGDANGDIKIWDRQIASPLASMPTTKKTSSGLIYPTYVNHLAALANQRLAYVNNHEIGILKLFD